MNKTIIGLEIHVQLNVAEKLFCKCRPEFGSEPNTTTCPVCTGQPGAMPVLNKQALEVSIRAGRALNCRINEWPSWDRKHYYYPDLPKGYQISQFDQPVCLDGFVDLGNKKIRLIRAHLEEDAGKSLHSNQESRVDLNRAGTALLEIVTAPDLTTPEEAKQFLTELKLMLIYFDISQCNMQEGNLRVDANINLDLDGQRTTIVEVKNLNSFKAVEKALMYEIERQTKNPEFGGKETRGWNVDEEYSFVQRTKESAADYRFLPEPDLVPVRIG